ncbi:MAG: isocitrate dehydrogenase (NAD(+)) [Acidobacteria bacterium]|nr:MAG: isocitrate dehydrogenase (NAD(+)) [Acidobacteriota bacterium]PYQ21635.1 MAG: isocitrate dehydrogenase (NAD(+)) [Acidobacteriota bacterium]
MSRGPCTVTLIPGDGIGPEVVAAAVRVLTATGIAFEWETEQAGSTAIGEHGTALPPRVLDSVRRNKVALKGPTETPVGTGHRSVNVELRKQLDLYANLRPVQSLPGIKSRYDGVDLVVVRENTEDLYSGLEHVVVPGVVESLKIITEKASTRIARFAFDYARGHGRKKVTAVHKANIMKLSDGLFLDCCRKVAKDYEGIGYEEMIVDNACMQLVLDPSRFDVLLLENLYGDIVSDLCAGFVGGLGMAPGANIGADGALFEAVHGSAPDIAGKNLANPVAVILSGALMLDHLGEHDAAERVRRAVRSVLVEGRKLTRDLGGTAGTSEIAEAIASRL